MRTPVVEPDTANLSDEQIVEAGLAAIERALGKDGMIRFVESFEHTPYDYSERRDEVIGADSLSTILERVKRRAADEETNIHGRS
jgi:hypothetical protein